MTTQTRHTAGSEKKWNHRCEGWRRNGGAFTLGPVTWSQCESEGIVVLKFKDEESGKVKSLPACKVCWQECIDNGIKILKATPITLATQPEEGR